MKIFLTNRAKGINPSLLRSWKKKGFDIIHSLDTSLKKKQVEHLLIALSRLQDDELVLVINSKDPHIQGDSDQFQSTFESFHSDVVFCASANFPFSATGFNLYYWKYYPRENGPYHYLSQTFFVGRARQIVTLLTEINRFYEPIEDSEFLSENEERVDLFHRFYIDSLFRFYQSKLSIRLDHDQKLLSNSNGRASLIKWPLFNDRHAFIFSRLEHSILKLSIRNKRDVVKKDHLFFNKKTKHFPLVLDDIQDKENVSLKKVLNSLQAYVKSITSIFLIFLRNSGIKKNYQIFRYSENQASELKKSISELTKLLKRKEAFCFSHFNDGEITFIKKFLDNDHQEVWFGRRQNKYDKKLGELLTKSFQMHAKNYFIGIPCKKCHPKLYEFAHVHRTQDSYTIPAMTLHHNLSHFPELLGLIRSRKVYFIANPKQDLSFFSHLGFDATPENVITIPFKNAHLEYDRLKDQKFENESVVIMMCGMLGKILAPRWFKINPDSSFITFGSSFDDFIQNDIPFNLYPKLYPFSQHFIRSRYFLFGKKKKCPACFNLSTEFRYN